MLISVLVKRMTSMLDSDQFKRENFTFMRKKKKKKRAQYNLKRDCICDAK